MCLKKPSPKLILAPDPKLDTGSQTSTFDKGLLLGDFEMLKRCLL